jgi:hypothetical protein
MTLAWPAAAVNRQAPSGIGAGSPKRTIRAGPAHVPRDQYERRWTEIEHGHRHATIAPGTQAAQSRAGPEQPGQAGPGRSDDDRELLPGLTLLSVDPAQVIKQGLCQFAAGRRHRITAAPER